MPTLTLQIDIAASAFDSNLTDFPLPIMNSSVGASDASNVVAEDTTGTGDDVWFSSDASGSSPIASSKAFWDNATNRFLFYVKSSPSSISGTTIHLQVGGKPPGYNTNPYPSHAVALLPLIDTADDQTTNNHDGTVSGAVFGVSGPDGFLDSVEFDGSFDTVEIPTLPHPGATPHSIRTWVYPDSSGTGRMTIASDRNGEGTHIRIETNGEITVARLSGTNYDSGLTVTYNTWQYFAFTTDGAGNGSCRLGGSTSTDTGALFENSNVNVWSLGAFDSGQRDELKGRLANFSYDDVELSDDWLKAEMNLQGSSAATYFTVTDVTSSAAGPDHRSLLLMGIG